MLEQVKGVRAYKDDKVLYLTSRKLKERELPSGAAPTHGFARFGKDKAIISSHGFKDLESRPQGGGPPRAAAARRRCGARWRGCIRRSQRRGRSRARGHPGGSPIWIPAYAGMTFDLCIHAPGSAFNLPNTLL